MADPAFEQLAAERRGGPTLTRTDGIVTLAFQAFGASYTVNVECHQPFEDMRCVEDDFVLDIADQLAVFPGGER